MTAQTDPFNDFVRAVNAAASSIASFGRNVMIKVSGGYTDNEYADAMMREHQAALVKQGKGHRGARGISEVPKLARCVSVGGRGVSEIRIWDGVVLPTKNGDRP